MMMSRMLCVVVFLVCLISSHECNGRRHLTSIDDDQHDAIDDDKAKLLITDNSTMKGGNLEKDLPVRVDDDDVNLQVIKKGKQQVMVETNNSNKKKEMILKEQSSSRMKKFKEEIHPANNKQAGGSSSTTTTNSYRVPTSKKKRIHNDDQQQQPGFNLDYSPPKTHPPSHN